MREEHSTKREMFNGEKGACLTEMSMQSESPNLFFLNYKIDYRCKPYGR